MNANDTHRFRTLFFSPAVLLIASFVCERLAMRNMHQQTQSRLKQFYGSVSDVNSESATKRLPQISENMNEWIKFELKKLKVSYRQSIDDIEIGYQSF